MKVPNKAYNVFFFDDRYTTLSYLPRVNVSSEKSCKYIKLPEWLSKTIEHSVRDAYNKGICDTRWRIKKELGL